jgi:squalene-hopene/tetraprenyl-beta-curcumene cyclase
MSRKQKSPDFYQNYPALFHSYFPQVKPEIVETLSNAGYAYYQSILHLDAIIDKQEFHRIFLVLDFQQTAIKRSSVLSMLFSLN